MTLLIILGSRAGAPAAAATAGPAGPAAPGLAKLAGQLRFPLGMIYVSIPK
jgi:formate/nitrite transporter FocA (FNT family)